MQIGIGYSDLYRIRMRRLIDITSFLRKRKLANCASILIEKFIQQPYTHYDFAYIPNVLSKYSNQFVYYSVLFIIYYSELLCTCHFLSETQLFCKFLPYTSSSNISKFQILVLFMVVEFFIYKYHYFVIVLVQPTNSKYTIQVIY